MDILKLREILNEKETYLDRIKNEAVAVSGQIIMLKEMISKEESAKKE